MMRNLGKLFLTLCLLTVGGGVVANAQIDSQTTVQANVPFAFSVANTTLPAGKYEIKMFDEKEPNVLEIINAKGRPTVIFETETAAKRDEQTARKTELVFDKVGDQYFLVQVWLDVTRSGVQLPISKMEKRLTDGGKQSERHSIAALLKR